MLLPKKTISIIGSGPSGFYTAYRLLTKSPIPIHIKLWEKLPVPFGLSRYGVAPDHPEVKNCEIVFTECMERFGLGNQNNQTNVNSDNNGNQKFSTIEFIGGVEIGKQIKLKQLVDNEDIIVFSYGCNNDKKLNLPGENDTNGVINSREFVNWYNGHLEYSDKFNKLNWSKIKDVIIIGNGNVALDITRVLLSNQVSEIWRSTDISREALSKLRNSSIESLKIVGRRDFIHSKFTNKELRELWELEKYGIKGNINSKFFEPEKLTSSAINLTRVQKRRTEICSEYLKPFNLRTKKNYQKFKPMDIIRSRWEFDYLKTPISINKDETGNIKSVVMCDNILTADNKIIKQIDTAKEYKCDLLIKSLGYKGDLIDGMSRLNIKFNYDHLVTQDGRIMNEQNEVIPGLYSTGWISQIQKGVIATTMQNSFMIADEIIEDIQKGLVSSDNSSKGNDVKKDLFMRNIPYVNWSQWEMINQKEILMGEKMGSCREKFIHADDIKAFLSNQ